MNTPPTTDLCDTHEDLLDRGALQVMQPGLIALGQRGAFHGVASTLRLYEDNSLLAESVRLPGAGGVLVVDGGGSLRRAVLGGNLARAAQEHGWSGVIVFGAVRDADEIDACGIGVRALALCPRRPLKRGAGERQVEVSFLGVHVRPGAWIYADRDGVIVSDVPLHA